MKKACCVVSVFLLIAIAYGCTNRFQSGMIKYADIRQTIRVGDPKDEVIDKLEYIQKRLPSSLGRRDALSFPLEKRHKANIYFMRTAHYEDGEMTDDEFTPYIFIDDRLMATGWSVLGGPKTRHDPQIVAQYLMIKQRRRQQTAATLQNVAQQMQTRRQTAIQNSNQMEQQRQMRDLNTNLRNLNRNLGGW